MMKNLWHFFILLLLLTHALVGSVEVGLAVQPNVIPNGLVTTVEGDTVAGSEIGVGLE